MSSSKGLLVWLVVITAEVLLMQQYNQHIVAEIRHTLAYTVHLLGW
ncbi:MAG: hypothetical protein KKB13_17470 [Chloroflexi bacterium]|nr:hypothetical protein [Chloroflexota bacterium]